MLCTGCDHLNKMKRDADKAREQSDSIMKAFKTIDKDLQRSNKVIDSTNKKLLDSLKKPHLSF
jgi:hypothetical protein